MQTDKASKRLEMGQATVSRAVSGQSVANYEPIILGFLDKGISEDEIQPRVNIFTYNAWLALGRQVRKGEKGVKGTTWVETKNKDGELSGKYPKSFTVFHISQTEVKA